MMKRLIAAAALLIFTAICCFAGNRAVNSSVGEVDSLLTAAELSARGSDMESARQLCEQAEEVYVRHEQKLFMFVYHSLVEDLGEQLSALPDLASEDSSEDFLSQLELVKVIMTHIERDNQPSLRSVF